MQEESFLEGQSKVQVEACGHGALVQANTETFNRAQELPIEDFQERIMHFKTNLMMLKQRVWIVQDIVLHENRKIEELIGVCAESMTQLSSVDQTTQVSHKATRGVQLGVLEQPSTGLHK